MAHSVQLVCFLALLSGLAAEKEQSRWSRQISSYTADISDWVPLPGPVQREPPQIKRQAIAEPRILSEPFPGFARPTGFSQETFPSRMFINSPANRQLYLQAVPSAPQNYLSDQGFGQSIRFGLAQPNLPLNNVFLAPQYNFDSVPQFKSKPTPIPTTQIKFDNIPSIPIPSQPLAPQVIPYIQSHKTKTELPKFVDGYRVENITRDISFAKKKPQASPKIKFESYEKSQPEPITQGKTKVEREEVQLLYVPLESLNRGQFNFRSPLSSSQLVNTELFSQNPRPNPLKQNLASEFQNSQENYNPVQHQFSNFNTQLNGFNQVPNFMTMPTPIVTIPTTTPKPKRLKPHQPPLAIFLTQEAKKNDQVKVGDVLYSLKNANTVAVLDSVNPANAPKVFIGPNSLSPPENYVKFELPYLSNIEHTDKKLRQLPFFVAPLSYNTPQGFAKIPFPSPHVGSVVINSQIRETNPPLQPSTKADVIPNSYTAPPQYKPKAVTQKPKLSYYSTVAPMTSIPNKYEQNYYSFEPQTVSTLRPIKELEAGINTTPSKSGSYFLSNVGNQHRPSQYVNFPQENNYKTPDYNVYKTTDSTTTTITTTSATPSTTSKPLSTYPSQLLETHNPYSINQAFHFSTPVDYQNFFDEYKETYATSKPDLQTSVQQPISSQEPTEKPYEELPEKQTSIQDQPSPSTYQQNYTPEIHYESEIPHSRHPTYNTNDYTSKSKPSFEYRPTTPVESNGQNNNQLEPQIISENINYESNTEDNLSAPPENNESPENHPTIYENLTEVPKTGPATFLEEQSTKTPYGYNQYETVFTDEKQEPSSSSTTTTTTRRIPTRARGRPRYSTTKSDTDEYSTRTVVTRRPLRERRPIPSRPRYEPNKVTSEKPTSKPLESGESTTRSYRTRSRGRVHYKATEGDESFDKRNKQNSKQDDLAYQRDILHQNYPVTLMERMSTVDIEAITEPAGKVSSTNNLESTNSYDTENAYSNDQLSITQHTKVYSESKQEAPEYLKSEVESEDTYVPRISSTRPDDFIYHSRSSAAPVDAFSSDDETKEEQNNYSQQTTPIPKSDNFEDISSTKLTYPTLEEDTSTLNVKDEPTIKQEDETENSNIQDTNTSHGESIQEQEEPEENIVQTTPSYNRVRVRPGVIRQYHQASSTETSRIKNDRRKSAQAITYRPAFDRRRTTMRIDEIQADLKTKQILVHPEAQDIHPVYKPEPTTEASALSATQDSSSKRGQFRRRRPSYTTTPTEASSTKKMYEVKNRFRGRRPTTEKPTEKPEVETDVSTTTVKSNLYSRYSHRPKLSERFHKKTENEGNEDQDSNYSLHRPKYAIPDTEHWSPKFTSDSFKPYNPNDVTEISKSSSTDNKRESDELDIITAKNEYDNILISVTPATNNKASKIPDIPPTLEALVEQSKVTKSDSGDAMSTFESMLEEVMKSLEEQDQDEYTKNVMKHKGGEIGEIPPEKIISSGETYSFKSTTPLHEETTTNITTQPTGNEYSHGINEEDANRKSRRRGFWKKVKVRPVTESIEAAESQYYSNTINRLGQNVESKVAYGKSNSEKPRVTTYKPNQQYIKNLLKHEDDSLEFLVSHLDIPKINSASNDDSKTESTNPIQEDTTKNNQEKATTTNGINPGDMDLGTGSPDPTLDDEMYYSEPTEPTLQESSVAIDRSDGFSLMDYLFGVTSSDDTRIENNNKTEGIIKRESVIVSKDIETEITTEQKPKIVTTESTYIPEEITAELTAIEYQTTETLELKKVSNSEKQNEAETTRKPVDKIESSSLSSLMDPANVVSTSMSTEVSHETEICFRGKCIKTNKDML